MLYTHVIIRNRSKDSKKLIRDDSAIRRFWDHCCATGFLPRDHPGRGDNVLGIYGDDCRYNKAGDKLIVITINCILQEPKRILTAIGNVFCIFLKVVCYRNLP